MTNVIVPVSPLLDQEESIRNVKLLANIVHALYEDVFKPNLDYGVIPGTGTKPVLLLPGMEKLMRALRLRPEYIPRQTVIDFDKPLFLFQYECRLVEIETGLIVGAAVGSANSHESKWRWRKADRTCPKCDAPTIRRSKYPPKSAPHGEPGWYCSDKGCGAQFAFSDPAIAQQQTGRVENPDIADQLNTIDKIAQKRALAAAIKGAANVSELFTVGIDDLADYAVKPAPAKADADAVDAEVVEVPDAPAKAKSAPAKPVTHWTEEQYNSFVLECKNKNVNLDTVLKLLGVRKIRDYAPGFSAARAALKAFADAKPAPAPAEPELFDEVPY